MPSHVHEVLLELFRNRPQLAPHMLRGALHVSLPAYSDVRVDAADLTDIKPTEYRADLVVLLTRENPVYGIIVEVQLAPKESKRFAWPAYVANLRARFRCPVCLLVVTASDAVARWAARRVAIGGGNSFAPLVLGPSGVPKITSPSRARADSDDLILTSLPPSMKQVIQMIRLKKNFRGEFARFCVATGRLQLVVRQLEMRFGVLPSATLRRLSAASSAEVERLAERLLTAPSLSKALGTKLAGRRHGARAHSAPRQRAPRAPHAHAPRGRVTSPSGRASRRDP